MRKLRFFCRTITDESALDPSESNHLSRVLRVQPGTPVELFDGKGTLAEGIVGHISPKQVIVRTQTIHRSSQAEAGRIVLAVSFAKGQRFDWLVEKCTELGADHIAAVVFERTVKLGKDTALPRLEKIAMAAAKQCGRLFLPILSGPAKLKETLDSLTPSYPRAALFFGDPQGQPINGMQSVFPQRDALMLVGPEGGLTDAEIQWLGDAGALPVCLNPNILRVETAAMAFCAALAAARL
ncbi:MAG: 16S rRNA (uracil(1498)-N(3))-methyltransferase [Planctomycetales bacterium]|nr:16S rRNA (uracil(1498)-N(3))-methyltransferase [Planctomycetales bacterium]